MEEEIKLLCVDDEPNVINSVRRLFLDSGYAILTAKSAQDGLGILEDDDIQIVKKQALNMKLLEKKFPGITQLEYDEKGRIIIQDVPDAEMARIVAEFDLEYSA